jgi:hypothetical protein
LILSFDRAKLPAPGRRPRSAHPRSEVGLASFPHIDNTMMNHEFSHSALARRVATVAWRSALLWAVVSAAWSAPAWAQTAGIISGTVTNAVSGAPISGVSVNIYNSSGSYVGSATSNASGLYTRSNLSPGTYYLATSNSLGYLDELYNDIRCGSSCYPYTAGTGVSVAAGTTTSEINFALTPGGTIAGLVTADGSGTPLGGVQVSIYDSAGNQTASVSTNASGAYSKNGLPPGSYYLVAFNSLGYLNELYDNISCSGGCWPYTAGTPVTVAVGATTGGVSFALSLGGSITGTITDAGSGAPLANVRVEARSLSGPYYQANATTNASGVYALIGLPTRSYGVFTSNDAGYIDEKYNNVSCSTGCWNVSGTPVAVTAGSVTSSVDFGLVLGGTIAGTVTNSNTSAPVSNVEVGVHNAAGRSLGFAVTNGTGQYAVRGLPAGTHYVKTVATGNYLNEVYADIPCPSCNTTSGASITVPTGATGVPVSVGGTQGGVDFALAPGGSITGTVTDASNGAPLANVLVEASNGTVTRSAQSNASGVYAIVGLFTGAYIVRTQSGMYGSVYVDEVYNNQPCAGGHCPGVAGTPVAATAGSVATGIDFALARGGSITGTVRNAGTGAPLPYVGVRVYRDGVATSSFRASANASGAYTVGGLPTGTYYVVTDSGDFVDRLYGGPTCPYQVCKLTEGTPVHVTTGGTTGGIDFALSPGGRISGTVRDAASGLPVNVEVELWLYSSSGKALDYTYAAEGTGSFALQGMATGTYYVRAWSPEYVMQTYDSLPGYTPIPGATAIVVTAPETTTGVDFQLARGGTITGALAVEGTGEPLREEPLVYAVSSDGHTIVSFGEVIGTSYVLPGLPPGSYYVRTFNGDGLMDEVYPDVPCLFCDPTTAGQLVTVTGTETVPGIDFALAPLPSATNDSCANALQVTSTPMTHLVSVAGATGAVDDPPTSCGTLAPVESKSVWYRFTPPRNGTLIIGTAGSTTSPVVSVHTGSCGSFVEVPGACVSSPYWSPHQDFLGAVAPGADELRVAVSGGVTYSIQVANDDSDGATLNLKFDFRDTPRQADFDGDGKADVAVYRPASGTWFWLKSSLNNQAWDYRGWGVQAQGDTPVVGDFDGDGIADPTVFRPASGTWFVLESHARFTTWSWFGWGEATDTLVPGDYDGDGRTDAAVFRPATGTWYVRPSNGAPPWSVPFGQAGDEPIAGDFDGDGIRDPAVYRPASGTWFWLTSSSGFKTWDYRGWGVDAEGDRPAPGDYDGDGRTDLCVFRPASGTWFTLESHAAWTTWAWFGWGNSSDTVMPADYDGDRKTDVAIYRAGTGQWFMRSSGGPWWNVTFGQTGDVPLGGVK